MTRFAVVVVLHNSRHEFARLLETLPECELVVVDTGPDDGGAGLAKDATLIVRRDNPGFGAANNLALRHVESPVTVLLNPDTAHLHDLPELARRAQATGLHAPRLLNEDGTVQRSAHPLPGTLGAFLPAVSPWAPTRAEPYRSERPTTVGWAIAACLAAQTQLIHFDERIHLWAEDMDLCLRARNHGVRTLLHPDLHVTHTGRHSVGNEPFDELARNRRDVVARTRGRTAQRLDDAAQALTFATRAWKGPRERQQLKALVKAARPGLSPGL